MISPGSESNASSARPVQWRFVFLTLAVIAVGAFFVARHFTPISICQRLQPGTTRSDLVAALGEPFRSEPRADGALLYFDGGFGAAGPIRAVVDTTSHVAVLRCCEDCKPLWGTE